MLNISETTGDRGCLLLGKRPDTAESVGDVTDDVTWPDNVMAVTSTAGVPRGLAHEWCPRIVEICNVWCGGVGVCVYLADTCSWRRGIHRTHTDRQRRPCWLPVHSEFCRHTACWVNSARLSHTCYHTARDNAQNRACHYGHRAPCRTWVDHRRVDMTVPGCCWSTRTAVA